MTPGQAIIEVTFYNAHRDVKAKQFHLLDTTPLSALRDKFSCPFDETALLQEEIMCTEPLAASAFFFIEGVFYNDMRREDALDYSIPFRERGLGSAGNMANTTLGELSIQLDHPYLYYHQVGTPLDGVWVRKVLTRQSLTPLWF